MIDRRQALVAVTAFGSLGLGACATGPRPSCAVLTPETQAALTPELALQRLKDGNERFASGRTLQCDLMQQVKATAHHQSPFAAVVGCIDSRVPPELVFDQRIGDIFVARVAGNFVNTDILGSLEYATAVAGARLVVVLGHSECGAIKGALDDVRLGNLTALLQNIRPSIQRLGYQGVPGSRDRPLVQRLAEQNARDAVRKVLENSEVIAGQVRAGRVKIVPAMHDVGTGRIGWLA